MPDPVKIGDYWDYTLGQTHFQKSFLDEVMARTIPILLEKGWFESNPPTTSDWSRLKEFDEWVLARIWKERGEFPTYYSNEVWSDFYYHIELDGYEFSHIDLPQKTHLYRILSYDAEEMITVQTGGRVVRALEIVATMAPPYNDPARLMLLDEFKQAKDVERKRLVKLRREADEQERAEKKARRESRRLREEQEQTESQRLALEQRKLEIANKEKLREHKRDMLKMQIELAKVNAEAEVLSKTLGAMTDADLTKLLQVKFASQGGKALRKMVLHWLDH